MFFRVLNLLMPNIFNFTPNMNEMSGFVVLLSVYIINCSSKKGIELLGSQNPLKLTGSLKAKLVG